VQLLPMLGLALLGIGAGGSVVVQQVLVASLRVSLGPAPWAALISYVGGTLTMVPHRRSYARALDIDDRGHQKLMAIAGCQRLRRHPYRFGHSADSEAASRHGRPVNRRRAVAGVVDVRSLRDVWRAATASILKADMATTRC
jgi:hypothetical protein